MTTTLNLSKTTVMLDLTKAAPQLKKLRGVLTWGMHPVHGKSLEEGFDLDVFVFATSSGKLESVAYFNNKVIHSGGVILSEDNRTGGTEEVTFELSKVNPECDKLEIFVFIYGAKDRKQDFSMIQGGEFKLIDSETNKCLQSYVIQHYMGDALHVGSLKRISDNGWGFYPVGHSASATPNEVVRAFS